MEQELSKKVSRSQGVKFVTNDPAKDLADLTHIMLNLRKHTKLFDIHYGSEHKRNKQRWEQNADEWLQSHVKPD
jgi:hypothetical protein